MNKRLANFGGVGGQSTPFSPGSAPQFNGGGSGYAGYGVNSFSGDVSMDDLMGRFRKPDVLGFERPLESLLEAFHEDLEKDAEPYLLTFEERMKLDTKKKIRRKEQELKDIANGERDNHKIFEIKKKINTVEELLEEFRKNTNVDFGKLSSSKYSQSYYRRPGSNPLLDEYLPTVDEHADDELANARLTQPFTGPYDYQYNPADGLDDYKQGLNNPERIDMHAFFDGLMTTPNEQDNTSASGAGTLNPEPSPITPEATNNNQPIEQKLQKLKSAPKGIGRLDPDMFYGLDWDEKIKGKYPQRGVTNETPYDNDGMGGYATNGIPDTSNNPYFGVL